MEKTSDKNKQPFFVKEALCPVCKNNGQHYYLRDHTFTINTRDSDYFVSNYSWAEPEYNQLNLHGFGLWHCEVCKFTDDRSMFYQKDVTQGRAQFDYLKKLLIAKHDEPDAFFERIAPHIAYPTHDLLVSLNLTLLAIYVHTLPDSIYQNYDKIAKLYLRASWMFRLISQKPEIDDIEQFLKSYNIKFDRLQANSMNMLHSVEELNETVVEKNRRKSGTPEWQRMWAKQYGVLTDNYNVMCEAIDKVISAIRIYYESGNFLEAQLLNADKNLWDLPYKNYHRYSDFVTELNELFPDLPVNEEAAYKKAAEYFQRALSAKVYDLDSLKKFKIYDLIISISEKGQDYTTALQVCNMLESMTTNYYQSITERLRKQEVIPDETVDPEHLKSLLRRNQEIMRSVKIKQKRIRPLKLRRDKQLAQQIVAQYQDLDAMGLRIKMEEAQIDEEVMKSYIAEVRIEKKKGIFEIFKF